MLPTTKSGQILANLAGESKLEKVAYITIPDVNGGVTRAIGAKLTIGSEVGELIIEDASMSARHCTFIRNRDVICLIDHSSVDGTFLNKKRLEPGRTFIIDESDKLQIGSFKAQLEFLEEPAEEDLLVAEIKVDDYIDNTAELSLTVESSEEVEPELEFDSEVAEVVESIDISKLDVEEVELDPKLLVRYYNDTNEKMTHEVNMGAPEKPSRKRVRPSLKTRSEKKVVKYKPGASGVTFRLLALGFDVIACLTILNIFYVFEDFKTHYASGAQLIKAYIIAPLEPLVIDFPEVFEIFTNIKQSAYFEQVGSFLILLLLFRIITSIIFSVSFGSFIIGMRAFGHRYLKRILAPIREILGAVTWPFLFFDLPTFVSKRSFKEIITGTLVYTPSRLNSIALVSFFLPVMVAALCFSPLIKGGELLLPVTVKVLDSKKTPWSYSNKVYSQFIGMTYDLSGNNTTLPLFQVETVNKEVVTTYGLSFVNKDSGLILDIRKIKDFSMLTLYEDFVKLNLLSKYFQPAIYSLVKDISVENDSFKRQDINKDQIISETQHIIHSIFSLRLENITKYIEKNGPILAGHREFREKIETLVSHPFKKLSLLDFGNESGVLFSHGAGYDNTFSYINLGESESELFHLSGDISAPKFKLLTMPIEFGNKAATSRRDPISEFISNFVADPSVESFELAQQVYNRYFNVARAFLLTKNNDAVLALINNVKNITTALSRDKSKNQKLFLNLTELMDSLVKGNKAFFNISETKTVLL